MSLVSNPHTSFSQKTKAQDSSFGLERLVAISESMQHVIKQIQEIVKLDQHVFLLGELGTGKSEIARIIYELGGVDNRPWRVVNCATNSPSLIEERLFGKGEDVSGLIQANNGCILIEEVNRLSETAQIRLLQVIREGKYQQPNGFKWQSTGIRVIAASHVNLKKEVTEGRFREDLYWALSTISIKVPPLRQRRADIEVLAQRQVALSGKNGVKFNSEAVKRLKEYMFPGNLLELRACVNRAVLLSSSKEMDASLLPVEITGDVSDTETNVFRPTDDKELLREYVNSQLGKCGSDRTDLFELIVRPLEKELIVQLLELCNQTQVNVAKRLGINRNTLKKKLDEFGLSKSKNESTE